MRAIRVVAGLALAMGLVAGPRAQAAVIETPANGGRASGIGVVAGWKCQAGQITVAFDGGEFLPAAWGVPRGDTAGSCGDRNNGWVMQFNFALLGDGNHVVRVYDNGTKFAEARFTVATLGVSFLRGVSGAYTLPNFPAAGASARVEWDQGAQGFMVTGVTWPQATPRPTAQPTPRPTPPPTNCPTNGPLTDLRRDCRSVMYFYSRGSVLAGVLTTGDAAGLCLASPSADVVCAAGPVRSAAAFDLTLTWLGDDPDVRAPLRAGSRASFRNDWRTLDFLILMPTGTRYDFADFEFMSADPVTGGSEPLGAGEIDSLMREVLRGSTLAGLDLLSQGETTPSVPANRRTDAPDQLERITRTLEGLARN